MSRLTKGLFIEEWPRHPLFDLRHDQERLPQYAVVGGATWYNRDCEFLGWGDLAPFDYTEIVEGLAPGEMFIILPPIPGRTTEGLDHVIKHAWHVIMPGVIYLVPGKRPLGEDGEPYEHPKLGTTTVMSREHLLDLLTSPVPAS